MANNVPLLEFYSRPSHDSFFFFLSKFIYFLVTGTTSNGRSHLSRSSTTVKSTDSSLTDGKEVSAEFVIGGGSSSSSVPAPQSYDSSRSLRDLIKCHDKDLDYRIAQKGEFWVLYNYVPANRTFACHESVTYTTHADFTFLDNLKPLVERWKGPISLALYAPGTDFVQTLASIRYLRKCGPALISEYVTFHVYFEAKHLPKTIPKQQDVLKDQTLNCAASPPWYNVSTSSMYKSKKKLLYPVNVGRNVARDSAQTHYVLASDIELYPSPGIISDFLDMVRRQDAPLRHDKPKVFPLCLFEVESYAQPPTTKEELVSVKTCTRSSIFKALSVTANVRLFQVRMLANETAIPFHKHVCPHCHTVPKGQEWIKAPVQPGLHVFHIAKRKGHWEPIFIGTNSDPYYDERLSWEGRSDKMTQVNYVPLRNVPGADPKNDFGRG